MEIVNFLLFNTWKKIRSEITKYIDRNFVLSILPVELIAIKLIRVWSKST